MPASGPAVVAANHPSYLDPLLLSLQVAAARSASWPGTGLFKVPLLARCSGMFGAFPVDVRPGQGREAYARAKALVVGGRGGRASSPRASARGPAGWSRRCARARPGWPGRRARRSSPPRSRAPSAPGRTSALCPRRRASACASTSRSTPRRYRAPARGGGAARRCWRSCAAGWSARCCPGSRPTCARRCSIWRPRRWPRGHELLAPAACAAVMSRWRAPWLGLLARGRVPGLPGGRPRAHPAVALRQVAPQRVARCCSCSAPAPAVLRAWACPWPPGRAWPPPWPGPVFPTSTSAGRSPSASCAGSCLAWLLGVAALAVAPVPAGLHVALLRLRGRFRLGPPHGLLALHGAGLLLYATAAVVLLGGGPALALHAAAGLAGWLATRAIPYHRPAGAPPAGAVVGAATGPRADSREPTT